jgi:hypothetical protein
MALFANLHHVSDVMTHVIRGHLSAQPLGGVNSGAPLDDPKTASEQIRVTLLWVTPQPTHRNDPWERTATGGLAPPPLTLAGYFLITTYGLGMDDEPVRAHELLGNVMQAFHTVPDVQLPLDELQERGEGKLSFVQVPAAADLMEKVYTPLQTRHRPWVLYEVAPIQLAMVAPATEAGPVVRPGGLRLDGGVAISGRPFITRVAPSQQAQGGLVRVDVELHGRPLGRLRMGRLSIEPSEVTFLSQQALVFTLPDPLSGDTVSPGAWDLHVQTGDPAVPPTLISDPGQLVVLASDAATVDAPLFASHDVASALILTGRGLATAAELVMWPDRGMAEPAEIRSLAIVSATAGSIEVSAAALGAAALVPGIDYRLSVRIDTYRYTPYVLARFHA